MELESGAGNWRRWAASLCLEVTMFFDERECDQLLSAFEFSYDGRNPPDGNRRGQFKAGWRDAAERGQVYQEEALERLAWKNLGYRLGQMFGVRDEDEIAEAFRCFARHYEAKGRVTL
jgi:hypothetical protein